MQFQASGVVPAIPYICFGESRFFYVVISMLVIAGEWGLLKKSGIKSWWALIPFAREYMLGQCAGREPEGRRVSLAAFGLAIISALSQLFVFHDNRLNYTLTAVAVSLAGCTGRHADAKGKCHKAFAVPQKDPEHNTLLLRSYNRPEFMKEKVKITPQQFATKAQEDAVRAKYVNK